MAGIGRLTWRSAHDAVNDRLDASFGQRSGAGRIGSAKAQWAMAEQLDLDLLTGPYPDIAGKSRSHHPLEVPGHEDSNRKPAKRAGGRERDSCAAKRKVMCSIHHGIILPGPMETL